jgi:hypothetical protein
MASAKKSQYLDSISVKDIFPRGENNTTLPQDQILVTDGQGGTTWQSVSALTGGGAFTTINTTPSTINATVGYPFISILDGPNAGLMIDPTAPNQLRLYANTFNQIKLEGNTDGARTISAYDNSTDIYKSTISFIAGDNIRISGDSSGNKLSFSAVPASNATTSTISSFITNMSHLNTSFQANINAFNSPYSAQPFIQYGSTMLDSSGQSTVTFSAITNAKQYKNTNYTVQLTYQYSTTPVLTKPLSFLINSTNAFTIHGDASRNVYWTTYGQIL